MTETPVLIPDSALWQSEKLPGHPMLGALSPTRAGDFTNCPLRYRYRTLDKLPEEPTPAAARGTLVHQVLDTLFSLEPGQRSFASAVDLLDPSWTEVVEQDPELPSVIGEEQTVAEWLASAEPLLATYFRMEDPNLLEPAFRELYVQHQLPDGPLLRGIVDRVDIAEHAGVRIVDYKTGRAPGANYEQQAMFQLRFYALVVWRMTGVLPAQLQLNYLGSGEFLKLAPQSDDIDRFEVKLRRLWEAIHGAFERETWPARPGPLCRWCSFQAFCPAKGGTELPLPAPVGESGDDLTADTSNPHTPLISVPTNGK